MPPCSIISRLLAGLVNLGEQLGTFSIHLDSSDGLWAPKPSITQESINLLSLEPKTKDITVQKGGTVWPVSDVIKYSGLQNAIESPISKKSIVVNIISIPTHHCWKQVGTVR